jgi:hypothetical protein
MATDNTQPTSSISTEIACRLSRILLTYDELKQFLNYLKTAKMEPTQEDDREVIEEIASFPVGVPACLEAPSDEVQETNHSLCPIHKAVKWDVLNYIHNGIKKYIDDMKTLFTDVDISISNAQKRPRLVGYYKRVTPGETFFDWNSNPCIGCTIRRPIIEVEFFGMLVAIKNDYTNDLDSFIDAAKKLMDNRKAKDQEEAEAAESKKTYRRRGGADPCADKRLQISCTS